MTETSYPPPPPPPTATPAKSRKTLVVALLLVLVIASAIALAYMATGGFNFGSSNNNPTPAPSSSASPSATATANPSHSPSPSTTLNPSATPTNTNQPTPTPTTTPQSTSSPGAWQGATNFRAGQWANYTMKIYDDTGTLSSEIHEKESISEDTYKGQNCWLLITDSDMTIEGETTSSTTIIYLSKNTLQGVRMETYMNGELIYGYDLNDTSTTDPGTTGQIDPDTILSYETITVTAGTFTDCAKASTTTTIDSRTTTSYIWGHQNVPVYGLVKMESYTGQQLSMSMELTAYGG